jgi:2,3-bisphosphoglycerate-independent phosphoglycerate mutase
LRRKKKFQIKNKDNMKKKALLMILDGWGIGKHGKGDVIFNTPTPFMDHLNATYPHSQLQASGENVGLPDGQMGNSEVGHLNIGAGRVVYQDLVKINRACADGSILKNPGIVAAYEYAKKTGKSIHLMGLTSDGGVHSSLAHLFKLIEIAKMYGIENTYVHCFMDGRDTDPRSGKGFIADLTKHCQENVGHVASIIGRFYAMDRDKRWNRVKIAYDQLVNGKGRQETDMVAAVQGCYDRDTEENKDTDEFMEPLVNSTVDGRIKEGDVIIFFNFRNDRAKELTVVLTQKDMPEEGMHTVKGLQYYCMTPYDATFTGVNVLFPKENVVDTLGEYLSRQGLKQLHTAETEKYAHVTFFFNGGREAPYEGEDRTLVNSPKVATYDLKPEMSAYEVKDKLVASIKENKYDFIVVNFANGDMVGHTGVYEAIAKAVVAVDACVKDVITAANEVGYETLIIADHGNADNAINPDGTPNTAHSLNPVPFIYVTENRNALVHNGRLADVAPSILHIMGLPQPADMTGSNLIVD